MSAVGAIAGVDTGRRGVISKRAIHFVDHPDIVNVAGNECVITPFLAQWKRRVYEIFIPNAPVAPYFRGLQIEVGTADLSSTNSDQDP